jgi:hypothetical protein
MVFMVVSWGWWDSSDRPSEPVTQAYAGRAIVLPARLAQSCWGLMRDARGLAAVNARKAFDGAFTQLSAHEVSTPRHRHKI